MHAISLEEIQVICRKRSQTIDVLVRNSVKNFESESVFVFISAAAVLAERCAFLEFLLVFHLCL